MSQRYEFKPEDFDVKFTTQDGRELPMKFIWEAFKILNAWSFNAYEREYVTRRLAEYVGFDLIEVADPPKPPAPKPEPPKPAPPREHRKRFWHKTEDVDN